MQRVLDLATSFAATVVRGGAGIASGALGRRPERELELYDFEGCPYCRKVREALSVLDLDARVYPCPKGGERFRPHVREQGGREQFPWLVDPNTGKALYESDDIVRYLFAEYGDGRVPRGLAAGALTDVSSGLASALRYGRGVRVRPSREPEVPLELWSFEGSPFCRLVREELSSLELPYRLHNVGKQSPRRAEFVRRSGKMQVPFLADPNTGIELFESADIVAYLDRTWGRS